MTISKERFEELVLDVAKDISGFLWYEGCHYETGVSDTDLYEFSHALIKRVEDEETLEAHATKLREQEPVAEVVDDFNGWTKVRMHKAMCCGTKLFTQPAPIPEGFDAWSLNPYTIALQKSVAEDYVPKPPIPELEAENARLRAAIKDVIEFGLTDAAYKIYREAAERSEK